MRRHKEQGETKFESRAAGMISKGKKRGISKENGCGGVGETTVDQGAAMGEGLKRMS